MNDKHVVKYMKIAKVLADENDACFSRKIGVVIVDPITNRIVGTGYNGAPPGTPHPDTKEFLTNFFWPQLTDQEKGSLIGVDSYAALKQETGYTDEFLIQGFLDKHAGCQVCPRRLVNAGPGERSELCSCGHAERHAITNAGTCNGCWMFCYCGVPCIQCTDAIIQAGIEIVYHLDDPDYHPIARWLFDKAGIPLIELRRKDYEV